MLNFSDLVKYFWNIKVLVNIDWIPETWWKPGENLVNHKVMWFYVELLKLGAICFEFQSVGEHSLNFTKLVKTWWKPGENLVNHKVVSCYVELLKLGEMFFKFQSVGEHRLNFRNLVKTWWKPGENLVKTWWITKLCESMVNFSNLMRKKIISICWWIDVDFQKLGENLVKIWWTPSMHNKKCFSFTIITKLSGLRLFLGEI